MPKSWESALFADTERANALGWSIGERVVLIMWQLCTGYWKLDLFWKKIDECYVNRLTARLFTLLKLEGLPLKQFWN